VQAVQAALVREDGDDSGAYVGRFRPDAPGVYRIRADARRGSAALGTASAAVLVGGSDPEMSDPRLNTQVLQRIALASGGRVLTRADSSALFSRLLAGLPAARLAVVHDLWHTGWSFATIVILLGAEWLLRRRWGLR
jgi:hypothetical protein